MLRKTHRSTGNAARAIGLALISVGGTAADLPRPAAVSSCPGVQVIGVPFVAARTKLATLVGC
jgi:hypothetical protein